MESQISTAPAPPLTTEERNWAMASHLSALVAIAGLPFGHVVGPLIVYLVKHKESAFVAEHSRSSLNYQITVSIAAILAVIVGIIVFAVVIAVAGVASPHADDADVCSRRDRHSSRFGSSFSESSGRSSSSRWSS